MSNFSTIVTINHLDNNLHELYFGDQQPEFEGISDSKLCLVGPANSYSKLEICNKKLTMTEVIKWFEEAGQHGCFVRHKLPITKSQNLEQIEVALTEKLAESQRHANISISALSKKTGHNITNILQSAHKTELETIANIFYELGYQIVFDVKEL